MNVMMKMNVMRQCEPSDNAFGPEIHVVNAIEQLVRQARPL